MTKKNLNEAVTGLSRFVGAEDIFEAIKNVSTRAHAKKEFLKENFMDSSAVKGALFLSEDIEDRAKWPEDIGCFDFVIREYLSFSEEGDKVFMLWIKAEQPDYWRDGHKTYLDNVKLYVCKKDVFSKALNELLEEHRAKAMKLYNDANASLASLA